MMKYYVYQHLKLDTNEIFYVGKGIKKRAWSKESRNLHWNNVVKKHKLLVEIVAYFKEEQDALDFEIEKIAEYRSLGYKLVNQTDGGDGVSGAKLPPASEERKEKVRKALTGIKRSKISRHKMSIAKKGKKKGLSHEEIYGVEQSKKLKENLSNKQKGRYNNLTFDERHGIEKSKIIRSKISKSLLGHESVSKGKTLEEMYGIEKAKSMKEASSKRHKNKPLSKEHCEKISKAKKGYKPSEEHAKNVKLARQKRVKIVECPHCRTKGEHVIMSRWHFNNCRFIIK